MSLFETSYKILNYHARMCKETFVSIIKIIIRYRKTPPPPLAKSNRCYLLGNGPSLKITLNNYFDIIKGNEIVCVNHFAQSEYFELLKPNNYVLLDEAFFLFDVKQNITENSIINATFKKFEAVNWDMNIYLPIRAKRSYLVTEILNKCKKINIYYFNYIVVSGYNWFKFFMYKKGLGMVQCQNVLGAALYITINRGYKEIFFFGADHSWHEEISITDNNEFLLKDKHFYNLATDGVSINISKRGKNEDIASQFFSLYKAFNSYNILSEYARYRNCKVYNSSERSFIDVFERKKP